MPRVQVSDSARSDLASIFQYTESTWGRDQAVSYIHNLDLAFQRAGEGPQSGRRRDDLSGGLRSLSAQKHVIYYREMADRVVIIRVLHAARDPDAAFPASDES